MFINGRTSPTCILTVTLSTCFKYYIHILWDHNWLSWEKQTLTSSSATSPFYSPGLPVAGVLHQAVSTHALFDNFNGTVQDLDWSEKSTELTADDFTRSPYKWKGFLTYKDWEEEVIVANITMTREFQFPSNSPVLSVDI